MGIVISFPMNAKMADWEIEQVYDEFYAQDEFYYSPSNYYDQNGQKKEVCLLSKLARKLFSRR